MKSLGPCSSPVYYLTDAHSQQYTEGTLGKTAGVQNVLQFFFCQTGGNSEMVTL